MQTGILVLGVILLIVLCLALFFTHREVRDMRLNMIKNRHDIQAIQGIMSEAGLAFFGPYGDISMVTSDEKKPSEESKHKSVYYEPSPSSFYPDMYNNGSDIPEPSEPSKPIDSKPTEPKEDVIDVIPIEDSNVMKNEQGKKDDLSEEETSEEETSSDEEDGDDEKDEDNQK